MKFRLITLGLILLIVSIVTAQPPAKPGATPPPQFPPFNGTELKLDDKQIPTGSELNKARSFASSNEPDARPQTDADRAVIEKVVRYDLYRLTWDSVITVRDPQRYGTIASIMTDLLGNAAEHVLSKVFPPIPVGPPNDQDDADKRVRHRAYVQILAPYVIQYARQVLQNKEISARLNATRVLARLAEWGREEAVDELVRVINHPQESDAVRVHAFHGLEEIFALTETTDLRATGLFASPAGQERFRNAVTAVLNWLDARTKYPTAQLQYLTPGEQNAIRFVRRAAELALGAAKRPLLVDNRNEGKQTGKVADLLVRIVTADASISPPPDYRERIDAAIALCQLRSSHSPSYQADYAAGALARCFADLGAFSNDDKDHKYLPWQYQADRLNRALTAFATQPGMSQPIATYVKAMTGAAKGLLEHFDDPAKNPTAVESFANWLQNNPPPNKEVYKPLGQ